MCITVPFYNTFVWLVFGDNNIQNLILLYFCVWPLISIKEINQIKYIDFKCFENMCLTIFLQSLVSI